MLVGFVAVQTADPAHQQQHLSQQQHFAMHQFRLHSSATPPPQHEALSTALLVLAADPGDEEPNTLLSLLFDDWKDLYDKPYAKGSREHDKRFGIWLSSAKAVSASSSAALCPLTKRPVMAMNSLADLDQEEFSLLHSGKRLETTYEDFTSGGTSSSSCSWWNIVCIIRKHYIFENGRFIRVNEPDDSFDDGETIWDIKNGQLPAQVDWTESGAVSGTIEYQGACGACYAMSAIAAAEAALYLKYKARPTICVAELLLCDGNSFVCDGGWPQSSFDYLRKKGSSVWNVDDTCAGVSAEEVLELLEGGYSKSELCSAVTAGASLSSNNYGGVQGYSYATTPCSCYASGNGCGCNSQNELLMAQNLASKGPAAVCVDSSTWQFYAGGVMTASNIGCSRQYNAMVHCLQVVGYALNDGEEGSGASYWIVRNSWGSGWGVNGFGFVQMGGNVCGIANDATMANV
jgi:hypothetical protein